MNDLDQGQNRHGFSIKDVNSLDFVDCLNILFSNLILFLKSHSRLRLNDLFLNQLLLCGSQFLLLQLFRLRLEDTEMI
jgi:hypothetical protein